MENYLDFVQHKSERAVHTDSITVSVDDLNPNLYSFQRDIVRWALAKGRAAIFADCGLGKTLMQLDTSPVDSLLSDKPNIRIHRRILQMFFIILKT